MRWLALVLVIWSLAALGLAELGAAQAALAMLYGAAALAGALVTLLVQGARLILAAWRPKSRNGLNLRRDSPSPP